MKCTYAHNLRQLYARVNCAVTDLMHICIWAAVFPVLAFCYGSNPSPFVTIAIAFVLPIIVATISGGVRRRTVGMRSENLVFTDLEGNAISFARCSTRILVGFLLTPFFPVSGVIFLLSPERGTLADRVLGTTMKKRIDVSVEYPHGPYNEAE
jgi:hypothetical protein